MGRERPVVAPLGVNTQNPASFLPALDVTAALTNNGLTSSGALAKGVTSAAPPQTSGRYGGDLLRRLGDHSGAPTGADGVEWTPDRDTLAYQRYNRGYKGFGFNAGSLSAAPEAKPETVDDIEGGFKKTFGHVLTVNADAFQYTDSDAQALASGAQPVGAVTSGGGYYQTSKGDALPQAS